MASLELVRQISRASASKIVLIAIDGLGGLPLTETGKTELETANTPNLDALAARSVCGLSDLVGAGITPGSAPGHLALFGYDPVSCLIGRGVLEALGIDFALGPDDIAARGNLCTVDENGLVSDRRAGRITTDKNQVLCRLLDGQEIDGVRIIVRPVKEHRLVVIFRGSGLSAGVSDSDPQQTGVVPKEVIAVKPEASRTASIANRFVARAKAVLADHYPANMVLLRGFSRRPELPTMTDIYKLKSAAIASYPMYRGLARVAGMKVLDTGTTPEEEMETLKQNFKNHDFFFVHIKDTDSAGEDGDFYRKVDVLEQVDRALDKVISLEPDVIVVTGDHSTPALLKGHSWHPVPVLLYSHWCRPDGVSRFSESACISGGLGRMAATEIMPLAMANALKLDKFGA
ncbi:MAG: 2,3-bisphosphoglycerate-independent phosphoglycerate mutase [Dehalococcoidales bacterium]|nr:2,3-bisphosphoglycerate-independent phosphoglycerate mutase [Dehalococcoidales bacterium]